MKLVTEIILSITRYKRENKVQIYYAFDGVSCILVIHFFNSLYIFFCLDHFCIVSSLLGIPVYIYQIYYKTISCVIISWLSR